MKKNISEEIASHFNGTVTYFPQKPKPMGFKGISSIVWKQNDFRFRCHLFKRGLDVTFMEGVDLKDHVSFSVNKKSNTMGTIVLDRNLSERLGFQVYNSIGFPDSSALQSFADRVNLKGVLERFDLQRDDFIYFATETVTFTVLSHSIEAIEERIRILISMVGEAKESVPENLDALPEEFSFLTPLLKKWVEYDDVARNELLNSASEVDLRELVETVAPEIPEIIKWCDAERNGEYSYLTSMLERLCEAATEASCMPTETKPSSSTTK